ncbi:EAL domain-containing protein [Alteromonas sp. KUL106]|uniref:EAL domain-containing protein n=1 Tax=Alteromonas sp. KUL106 TaxID=2480799 RepID=UPI0012E5536B|nr:EAL domain-containing protein [Alteromonas sp. KUL106]GFD77139.1 cyclic diguanylate phosphodiesterase [Tenacibaculum sp. KUL118]
MTKNEQQQYFLADNLKAIGVSLISVLAVTLLLGAVMFVFIREQEENRASEILDNVRAIFRDAEITLDYLNGLAYESCEKDNLAEMRKTLFRSRFVKEIGFYETNSLACSTYLGVLDEAIDEDEPDFYTKLDDAFWINTPLQLFDKQATGTIVRRGRYNAVLDMDSIIGYSHTQDWQLFYNSDKFYHMAGNSSLVDSTLSQQDIAARTGYFSLQFVLCDERYTNTCLQVKSDHGRVLDLHIGKLVLFVFVMLMTAALTHMITFNYLRRRRSLESRVKKGLREHKFYCLYQPFVDLQSGEVIGCEVLSRFNDEFGSIYPDEFIPQVKEQDMTWEFTVDMITKAMKDLNENPDIPEGFKVSFNLFPFDFTRDSCLNLDFALDMNIKNFKLVLEITEDEQIATHSAAKHIKSLKSKGFLFAIDDFGVGYSNLGQLKTLNCDYLKIDRSFVMDMEENSIRSSLIPHIVSIANGLNVELIAEGVENLEQFHELKELKIGYGQGWLFGKPQSASTLAKSVQERL